MFFFEENILVELANSVSNLLTLLQNKVKVIVQLEILHWQRDQCILSDKALEQLEQIEFKIACYLEKIPCKELERALYNS